MSLNLSIIDPCADQLIAITPIGSELVEYELSSNATIIEVQMIKSIEECPVDLSLQVICNDVDCAIESFLTIEEVREEEKFLLIIFTDNKNLTGDW